MQFWGARCTVALKNNKLFFKLSKFIIFNMFMFADSQVSKLFKLFCAF